VWTHAHANLWHPLTTLSHMLDCQLFDLKPGAHHLVNVALHNLAAVLLFFALRKLTNSFWPSAFVAAIFAIHPMRVESVAWIAERKDVLSGVFFMLTLAAYARYARDPRLSRYVTMSILYECGLLSKATLVTVPVILLLLDWWPLQRARTARDWPRLILEKLPLFALAAISTLATVWAQQVTVASLAYIPFTWRLQNAIVSLVLYLRQTIWPTDLAIFYPHPHNQLSLSLVLGCAILLAFITAVALLVRRKRPYLLVGWCWFLVLVFPVLGFMQAGLQARADRFTYLPHIGLTIAITWWIVDLTRAWPNRALWLGTLAAFVISALTLTAFHQTTFWRDSVSIWTHTLAVTENNQMAHTNIAIAFRDRGDHAQYLAHSNAADIARFETILKDFPNDIDAHNELGVVFYRAGRARDAVAQWRASLALDPNDGNALNNLAWALATSPDASLRDGATAVALAQKMSRLPGAESPMILRTLAAAFAESGDFASATDVAERAMRSAEQQHNDSLAGTLRAEIELYRNRQPYREK